MNIYGAFLLAPFPAAVLGAAIALAAGGSARPVPVLLFYVIALYAAQALFGVAIRLFLRRQGHTSPVSFTLGGLVMIAIPAMPYLGWSAMRNGFDGRVLIVLALWLICGGLTGLTHWWLMRPDVPRRRS